MAGQNLLDLNCGSKKKSGPKTWNKGLKRSQEQDLYTVQLTGYYIEETGMWINTNFPFLGASPDGIIFENCCPVGVLEVKCLKVFKTSSIHDFLNFWTCIQQTFGRAGYCSVWKKLWDGRES